MQSSIRRRSLVAILAALGCIFMMAAPASATEFVTYDVTTGLITADVDGPTGPIQPVTVDLANTTGTHPCAPATPPPLSTLMITTNHDSWVLGTELTDTNFNFGYFNLSNSTRNYRIKITHVTGSGEIGTEVGNTKSVTGSAVLHADITASNTLSGTDCGFTSATIRCMTITAFVTVENGTYHVDSGVTATADTYTLDLVTSGFVFTGACSAPFLTLEDFGTLSIEGLTLCNPAANTGDCTHTVT